MIILALHCLFVQVTNNMASAPFTLVGAAPANASIGRRACASRPSGSVRVRAAPATDVDLAISGVSSGLSESAKERCLTGKLNPFEKTKLAKCGTSTWSEIHELAELLRKGESTWEDLNIDDLDVRAKWNGMFHRRKQAPGTFMIRFRVRKPPMSC